MGSEDEVGLGTLEQMWSKADTPVGAVVLEYVISETLPLTVLNMVSKIKKKLMLCLGSGDIVEGVDFCLVCMQSLVPFMVLCAPLGVNPEHRARDCYWVCPP